MRILHYLIALALCIAGSSEAGLTKETKILTSDGLIPIEELTFGHTICGHSLESKTNVNLKLNSFRVRFDGNLVKITTNQGVITASKRQRFYTAEVEIIAERPNEIFIKIKKETCVEAQNLQTGDLLITQDGTLCICEEIDAETLNFNTTHDIFLKETPSGSSKLRRDPQNYVFCISKAKIFTHSRP